MGLDYFASLRRSAFHEPWDLMVARTWTFAVEAALLVLTFLKHCSMDLPRSSVLPAHLTF